MAGARTTKLLTIEADNARMRLDIAAREMRERRFDAYPERIRNELKANGGPLHRRKDDALVMDDS
jgi:hypothetical protein